MTNQSYSTSLIATPIHLQRGETGRDVLHVCSNLQVSLLHAIHSNVASRLDLNILLRRM